MEDVDMVQPAEHVVPSVLQADFQHDEEGQIQAVSEESPSIQPSTAVYREENENLTVLSTAVDLLNMLRLRSYRLTFSMTRRDKSRLLMMSRRRFSRRLLFIAMTTRI